MIEPRTDRANEWVYWTAGRETVRILDRRDLWGRVTCQVLVPSRSEVVWVPEGDLAEPGVHSWDADEVAWRAAAGRTVHLSAAGQALSLADCNIEPLPHQIEVLNRALSLDPVRLLLADEVGLGKTIEAGLIYRELKARGRARRVLVVAPKGMQLQWVAEMRYRFGEEFARVGVGGVPVDVGVDPWRVFDRVVCSLDSVKPLRQRVGWSLDRVVQHNERRFKAMIDAGWDLVVIDEAHHVAGSTEDVARHELARELAAITPHILLLSATPHSGKTQAFARLLGLLDVSFLDGRSLTQDAVGPLVIRTEKRAAIDSRGAPLFQPRVTNLEVVSYGDRRLEQGLYEAVTEYVRHGYDRAKRERRPAIGFLVLLMQRLVSSSTAAILKALERRSVVLAGAGEQLRLFAERSEQWAELSGEEQYEELMEAQGSAWDDEHREVDILLDLARKAASAGMDAKAAHLLELLRRVQREDQDPSAKVVIFTEFLPTQEMLLDLLGSAGIAVTVINGSMSVEERAMAQETFRESAQVLVSTDAGGEGINLQFAHLVINYDLPWNPMRIEQRIGRVDRIGQRRPVRAFNLVLENSVDQHVLRVLEAKLARILEELGADKWNDVLESSSRGIEGLYAEAITHPERLEQDASALAKRTHEEVADTESLRSLLRGTGPPEHGRQSEEIERVLSSAVSAFERWSDERMRDQQELLDRLPEVAAGESVPTVRGSPAGLWSLWEVRPDGGSKQRDCFALFTSRAGGVRPDIAERLWLELVSGMEINSGPPVVGGEWEDIWRVGQDHAYAPLRALSPDGDMGGAPWMVLRLLVRVET